ncbi:hypothetical protein CUR178_07491 [Leishmania enriettii]|uniref:Uncharacterized protein n=1 Tax=Leishmania enriettii TaxID=5663 RepID=A0A836HGQ9_LEIEN|nr:hypothetical protein CUR178_07491 [Leishmania enriettii]
MFSTSIGVCPSGTLRRTTSAASLLASVAAVVVESRRTHSKKTHPWRPPHRQADPVDHAAPGLSPSSDLITTPPSSAPVSLRSCGCPHPTRPTLSVPSMSFSTTPKLLLDRHSSKLGAASTTVKEELVNLAGGRLVHSVQREPPPRGSGIQPPLDFKHWAGEIVQLNPDYFVELARLQKPQYLWIGLQRQPCARERNRRSLRWRHFCSPYHCEHSVQQRPQRARRHSVRDRRPESGACHRIGPLHVRWRDGGPARGPRGSG